MEWMWNWKKKVTMVVKVLVQYSADKSGREAHR